METDGMNAYVAEALFALRRKAQLNQDVLGKAINGGKSNYYKLESNRARITIDHLYKLAPLLGVTVFDILTLAERYKEDSVLSYRLPRAEVHKNLDLSS